MVIRSAKTEDVPFILSLIQELADYENEPHEVKNTVENLTRDIFEHKYCDALVAEQDGRIIGFAIFYTSYSTWKGACVYLEDLYVKPEVRGTGAGSKLFDAVVEIAKDRKVARMDWQVLEWNQLAIDFYERKNAHLDSEWINGRLFFKENDIE